MRKEMLPVEWSGNWFTTMVNFSVGLDILGRGGVCHLSSWNVVKQTQ